MILMQQNFDEGVISYLVGDNYTIENMHNVPTLPLFNDGVVDMLSDISRQLIHMNNAKAYPDVVTLGFWLRKASLIQMKKRFTANDNNELRYGRGVAFHIAPSNVPVNFAYSLVTGLLTGNANVVRVPSKDFPQVKIISDAINAALDNHKNIKPYISLIRYDRNKDINDYLSSICDTRIIWGGDKTIAELRQSYLPPRSIEITFADRYSLAVIDSDAYVNAEDKSRIANDFYNDTYMTDQNACTSPRLVVWLGEKKEEAKKIFWETLHKFVLEKYTFQAVQAVNKLSSAYCIAAVRGNAKVIPHKDNMLVRVKIDSVDNEIMKYKDNSGYFFEYDCNSVLELYDLCNDKKCQTIGYYGSSDMLRPLLMSGIKGVDRVVPIGKTMDFDLIWDGYDLTRQMTRVITMI